MFYKAACVLFLSATIFSLPTLANEMLCAGVMRHAVDPATSKQYPTDRTVDVLHMVIEVTPNFRSASVTGTTTLRFKPLAAGLKELKLNAQDLRVSSATGSSPVQHFNNTGKELILTFRDELPADGEQEVTISYEAFPRKGLYFRTREMGYAAEDEHLFTQGEDIEARHWFPCYDSPNDKFTNELICYIPEGMTALSNGQLVSEQMTNGLKRVHWSQTKPHTSYLISLVAGYLKKVEDQYKDIPLALYTPASQVDLAQSSFAGTKEMMEFFETETGVPYPWEKYFQVCVQDFMWGGMENTSLTTLTDNTLFPKETENIESSQGLVAHELAHQWFGDLVTCEDWSQLWLNEGFATYYAHLYDKHKDGNDQFIYGLYQSAAEFINKTAAEDSQPVVFRKYREALELFGYLVYPKGGWILHMLRNELGEDLYRKCIRTYLERHQFKNVETHDLIDVIEELSGRSWDQFFDQWVFHPHHPELQVAYEWNEQKKIVKIDITQIQPLTNDISLFRFPLTIRLKGDFGAVDRVVEVKEKEEPFFFPLESAPKIVRLDPDYQLLAKIKFEPPRDLVVAQLKDSSDMMGRILALQQLSKSTDQATIDMLAETLGSDPFYGVRIEAAQALRKIHNKPALLALISKKEQEDARVRRAVVSQVSDFHEDEALQFALRILEKEANPRIRQVAVQSLNSFSDEVSFDFLVKQIRSESFENMVASSAMTAARGQNNPEYIDPMLEVLRGGPNRFTARGFASGLEAVAFLAKDESHKDGVFRVLSEYTANSRQTIRLSAIRSLGVLRDEQALPLLEKLGSGPDDAPETRAATKATEAIRSQKPVAPEVGALRRDLQELKKQNDEFKKALEELRKETSAQGENKNKSARKKRDKKAKKKE